MNYTFVDSDVAALLRIAGEVGELGHDLHLRRSHLLSRLLALVGGCWAVCSEMDPVHMHNGWAVPNTITTAGTLTSFQQDVIDRYVTGKLGEVDPCIPPLLRERKPVVTMRRADVVGRPWFESEHFDLVRRPLGFGESLYGILTTPDGQRLKLSMHRELNDPPFSERHVQLIQIFNENLAGSYVVSPRTQMLSDWSPQPKPQVASLPPRLRPVLQRLLAGDAEKQAAMKLGLSQHTVHQYTKLLYRTFGVNSRGELLAQFVVAGSC